MKLKRVEEFNHEIKNNKFLRMQAYTTYDKILKARYTSEL